MRRFTAGAAVLAVLAFAGGAAAAGRWVITNVNQIKPNVRAQLKGNSGRQGPQGLPGAQGVPGAQGPAGPAGLIGIQTVSASSPICAFGAGSCSVADVTASCPPGSYVVGGSANTDTIETPISTFAGATIYSAVANDDSPFSGTLTVTAICASGGGLRFLARTGSGSQAANQLAEHLRAQQH
jgi:hypothetical protein